MTTIYRSHDGEEYQSCTVKDGKRTWLRCVAGDLIWKETIKGYSETVIQYLNGIQVRYLVRFVKVD